MSLLSLPTSEPFSMALVGMMTSLTTNTNSGTVMFGFLRNPDIAGNRRLGVWKRVWLIAIDYHTVAGTAGVECKGD